MRCRQLQLKRSEAQLAEYKEKSEALMEDLKTLEEDNKELDKELQGTPRLFVPSRAA